MAVLYAVPAGARVTTSLSSQESRLTVPAIDTTDGEMRASLLSDVKRHPGDYVTFPTESEANRFMSEHAPEMGRETEPRMLELGVVGYWQGRTVVVIPLVPTRGHGGL